MTSNEIGIFSYLINMSAILFIVLFFVGFCFKVGYIAAAILAYPVYLSLYATEFFTRKSDYNTRRFFALNIPANRDKKLIMNCIASLAVFSLLPSMVTSYAFVKKFPSNPQILVNLLSGSDKVQLWFNGFAIIFVFIIYTMSYKTEIDSRSPLEKIVDLSAPSLWKTILKD